MRKPSKLTLYMKTLGQKIRELRELKGLSLREMSKKLEVSAAFLSDIELGRRFPSEEVLKKICKILQVKFDELKDLDPRAPIEELKRMSEGDPQYALALRTMVDDDVSASELLHWLQQKKKNK
ncbi:MAG: helix-turn-helix domain-containing protein [Candidatus Melainabacteria bacterium]|nr:helix-turn-helix domain-containing protein [Candidatus Melainabacteria bacterium]